MIDHKHCGICGTDKPLDQFNRDRARPDGHQTRCRSCMADYQRAYYESHKPRLLAKNQAWRKANATHLRKYRKKQPAQVA